MNTALVPQPSPAEVTLMRRGHPEIWWSTNYDVALRGSGFSWDVRGYYRALGVAFPYVSSPRSVLSRAYMAADGQNSHWATYSLKQLLHPLTRARYDACHLGEIFEDDYTAVDRRNAELNRRGAAGQPIQTFDADDAPMGMLDNDDESVQDEITPPAKDDDNYPYGVFIVGSVEEGEIDTEVLATWQHLIRREARRVALRVEVALGITPGSASWTVGDVGARKVVLLSQEYPPNLYDAQSVVAALSDH